MSAFQTQMFFFSPHGIFSETYYHPGPTFAAAMLALDQLSQARQAILPADITLGKLRVSRVPPDGNVLEAGVHQVAGRPPGELALNCVIVNFVAFGPPNGRAYRRAMSMRGLPKGTHDPKNLWWQALKGYLALVIQLGFCLQVCLRGVTGAPVKAIGLVGDEGVDSAGNPLELDEEQPATLGVFIACSRPHGIPAVDPGTGKASRVRLTGAKWTLPDGRRIGVGGGNLKVLSVTDKSLLIQGSLPSIGSQDQNALVRPDGKSYLPIAQATWQYDPTRKTGGRSKVKPSTLPPYAGDASKEQSPPPGPTLPVLPYAPGTDPNPQNPSGPITDALNTAYDVVRYCYRGYFPDADGIKRQIRIAKILNYEDAYLLALSGTDLEIDAATGRTEDISSSLGILDRYVLAVYEWVSRYVPRGSWLALAGDSLGGMECQNFMKFAGGLGIKLWNLTTFNSPVTSYLYRCKHTVRFAEYGDLVISASPVGYCLNLTGHSEQTFLFNSPNIFNPAASHRAIYTDLELTDYDALGYGPNPDTRSVLLLGNQYRFPAELPVPEL